jgi:hypothetical protein
VLLCYGGSASYHEKCLVCVYPDWQVTLWLVDAKNVQAKSFYEHYGFTACTDSPMTLYLPLG